MSTAAVEYISYYRNEIGERKFRKILKEIKTAKRFNYLMKASAEQRTMPGASDFFEFILQSVRYSFAGKQKLTFMALLLLNRWNEEVNSRYNISDDLEIDMKVQLIFREGDQLGI